MENKKAGGDSLIKRIVSKNEFILLVLIVLLAIVLNSANDGFLTTANFLSMSRGFAIEGIALIGMSLLLVMGMFDMSIGSVMVLAAYVFTVGVSEAGWPAIVAILAALAAGTVVGFINGIIVTRLKVNAFITTLGTMAIFRGLVQALSQGAAKRCVDKAFCSLSEATLGKLPWVFIGIVIVFILLDYALRNIRWFRQLYFIGGNANSAELTGINVKKMRLTLFAVSGFMAALSGCFSASRLQGSVPTNNQGTAMKLMVAAVIGGSSFNGGRGSILGSVLGLVFLTMLNNGMIMLHISDYWFDCILGIFLIAVVFINTLSETSVERNKAKKVREETLAMMNSGK